MSLVTIVVDAASLRALQATRHTVHIQILRIPLRSVELGLVEAVAHRHALVELLLVEGLIIV